MPTFHNIVWDFGVDQIDDIRMNLSIHSEPPNATAGTVYLQLYDFSMFRDRAEFNGRGIYTYCGLQSKVYDANQGRWRGKGLLFSRFESSQPADFRVAPAGWHELPTPQQIQAEGGKFIGVRNSFAWGKGEYQLSLSGSGEDASGIWYEFRATDLATGSAISCGSLRYPIIDDRRPLIQNKGSTWIEVTPHSFQLVNFPMWHVTFSNVVANGGSVRAKSATPNYADDQAPGCNSDVSSGQTPGSVDFRVGKGTVRRTSSGTVIKLS